MDRLDFAKLKQQVIDLEYSIHKTKAKIYSRIQNFEAERDIYAVLQSQITREFLNVLNNPEISECTSCYLHNANLFLAIYSPYINKAEQLLKNGINQIPNSEQENCTSITSSSD